MITTSCLKRCSCWPHPVSSPGVSLLSKVNIWPSQQAPRPCFPALSAKDPREMKCVSAWGSFRSHTKCFSFVLFFVCFFNMPCDELNKTHASFSSTFQQIATCSNALCGDIYYHLLRILTSLFCFVCFGRVNFFIGWSYNSDKFGFGFTMLNWKHSGSHFNTTHTSGTAFHVAFFFVLTWFWRTVLEVFVQH